MATTIRLITGLRMRLLLPRDSQFLHAASVQSSMRRLGISPWVFHAVTEFGQGIRRNRAQRTATRQRHRFAI